MAGTGKKRKPVMIPASICKREYVDYPLEMLACLDAPLRFGELVIRPPTLGVFMLLELTGNDFFPHPETCSFMELGRALWIARERRRALPAVERYIYADNARPLDRGAKEVLAAGGEELIANLPRVRGYLHALPWNGFRMLPESEEKLPPCPFLFDGEKAGILAAMAASLHITYDQLFWETPVTLLGLIAAGEARRNKIQGVGRPVDHEDVKRKLAEARAAADAEENADPAQTAATATFGEGVPPKVPVSPAQPGEPPQTAATATFGG